jgi:DNA-binding response OmpR family regulator
MTQLKSSEPLVLTVDDEAGIRRLLATEFEHQGFRVALASSGPEALEMAALEKPDLAVLDVMMPGMSGIETMLKLRESGSIPCILLTARSRDKDRVDGLNGGADDYVVKPFSADELAARIRAVLRRSASLKRPGTIVETHGIVIDLDRRLVMREDKIVQLTRTEWQLLQCLASKPGRVLLGRDLLTRVWGPECEDEFQYLRVCVNRLRGKLEQDPGNPEILTTVLNVGYKLELDQAEVALELMDMVGAGR